MGSLVPEEEGDHCSGSQVSVGFLVWFWVFNIFQGLCLVWFQYFQSLCSFVWSVAVYNYCLTMLKIASGSVLRNQGNRRNYLGQILWKSPSKSYNDILKAKPIFNIHKGNCVLRWICFNFNISGVKSQLFKGFILYTGNLYVSIESQ